MLRKQLVYEDYNGETQEAVLYFHLSKAELVELQVETRGGLDAYITKIVAEEDVQKMISFWKKLIKRAYGIKSPDGRRFEKSDKLSEDFMETPMYSAFFMELITDPEKATAFIKGVLPRESKKVTK